MARLHQGVTLDTIYAAMSRRCFAANIVAAPEAIWSVMDDERIGADMPAFERCITMLIGTDAEWIEGDALEGGSELWVKTTARLTLWLRSDLDLYGRWNLAQAAAMAPPGGRLLGKLVGSVWEKELTTLGGDAILKRPMHFQKVEGPKPKDSGPFRPFRVLLDLEFNWDLSEGG